MKTKGVTFLLLTFALTSFSQSNNTSASSKVAIKSNFSFQAIKVYQESAVFKVKDYYAYLELYANEEATDSLKVEIKTAIHNLFIQKHIKVVDFVSSENNPILLDKLLDKIENKNYKFKLTAIENSIVASDFWTTKYNLEVIETNQRCSIEVFSKIIFKPVDKKFGSTTKEIWTLFLGEME
ncbi:hypothetical protein [uncultured Flavobacterium sp.]|uniref:hypothetical protein n=1 Tax=uncultured Flavobacterium sp. TaxID=165435 RepID=UPI0030EC3DD6|tara:strand:+ start:49195 stop:49737 length:543 start_codon:yes stop_codon:yes gene_type:complete